MASSGYYYQRYRQKKDEVKEYERNLKSLRKILGNLTEDLNDEIRNVNKQLEELKEDMLDSVRWVNGFTNEANEAVTRKETGITADSRLSIVNDELEEEISRLESKKNNAAWERDDYYQKYKAKKDEEVQEFFNNIF